MKQKTIAAQTAQAIRKELKNAFPGVKFSVRSDNKSNTYFVKGGEIMKTTIDFKNKHITGMYKVKDQKKYWEELKRALSNSSEGI